MVFDQTIYAWRLADVRRVLGLAARLPGLRRVDLETNFRCAPEIVRRASRLVAHNTERFDKVIRWSPTAEGGVMLLPDCGDEVSRARFLLTTWAHDGAHGVTGTRAILARTNAELVPYAAVALELEWSYSVDDDGLLFDAPGVLEALDLAVDRAIRGEAPLLAVAAAAREAGLDTPLTAALLSWAAPYQDVAILRRDLRGRRALRTLLGPTVGARDVVTTSSPERVPPVEGSPPPKGSLTLATFHGTKGLEWDHVACVGHDEGIFPAARALRESTEPDRVLEEERRLAYVAWTRARRSLTIVYDPGAPSRFLREAFDEKELT